MQPTSLGTAAGPALLRDRGTPPVLPISSDAWHPLPNMALREPVLASGEHRLGLPVTPKGPRSITFTPATLMDHSLMRQRCFNGP